VTLAKFFFSSFCAKRKCPGACDEQTQKCDCSGHGKCDYSTGQCKCNEGYKGNNCGFHTIVQDRAIRLGDTKKYVKTAMGFKMNANDLDGSEHAESDVQVLDLHGE
jgi:hypothetical protein